MSDKQDATEISVRESLMNLSKEPAMEGFLHFIKTYQGLIEVLVNDNRGIEQKLIAALVEMSGRSFMNGITYARNHFVNAVEKAELNDVLTGEIISSLDQNLTETSENKEKEDDSK